MSDERVAYLQEIITAKSANVDNHDFKPIGHFYHLLLWTTHFNQHIKEIFAVLDRITFLIILLLSLMLLVPFVIYRYAKRPEQTGLRYGIIISIIAVGFSEMALEVVIMHGFQAICGYIYYQLAIILSSFMIGMASGSYGGIRFLRQHRNVFPVFKFIQLSVALFPILLTGSLLMSQKYFHNSLFIQLQFFLLTILAGFIAGFQFPLANHLYGYFDSRVEKVAGTIYASDLFGACIGAFITSALLIPILGIIQTCLAIALLNISIFFGLSGVSLPRISSLSDI